MSFASQINSISINSFHAMYRSELDEYKINELFSNHFSNNFIPILEKYIKQCIGTAAGGYVIAYETNGLKNDLFTLTRNAFIAMYRGEHDEYDIATLFAEEFKPFADVVKQFMSTCMTNLAAPPAIPVSPAGKLILTTGPGILINSLQVCSRNGWISSFRNYSDEYNIASLFANEFRNIGNVIYEYMSTFESLDGGGNLVNN